MKSWCSPLMLTTCDSPKNSSSSVTSRPLYVTHHVKARSTRIAANCVFFWSYHEIPSSTYVLVFVQLEPKLGFSDWSLHKGSGVRFKVHAAAIREWKGLSKAKADFFRRIWICRLNGVIERVASRTGHWPRFNILRKEEMGTQKTFLEKASSWVLFH